MGLLSRTSLTQAKQSHSFYLFVRKNNLRHSAIFSRIQDKMVITDCVGIDASTIAKSVSSVAFWNEKISEENKWFEFRNNDKELFFQFFSDKFAEKLSAVYIFKISPNTIFMTVVLSGEHIAPPTPETMKKNIGEKSGFEKTNINIDTDFSGRLKTESAFVFSVSAKNAAGVAMKNFLTMSGTINEALYTTICNAIFYKLSDFCASPNKAYCVENGLTKLVFLSSSDDMDEMLFDFHLREALGELILQDTESIEISYLGKAKSYDELKSIL